MSSESTDKLWCRAIDDLKKLVQEEEETSESHDSTFYAALYVKYNLVLALGMSAYDATVQVQKRIFIKLTLEHLICRIISLRACLQSADEIDSALISLKISPAQLDVASPSMLKEDTSVSTRIAKLLGAAATTEDSVDECRPAVEVEEHDETSITNTKSGLDMISSGNTDDKENATNNTTITIDDKDAAAKIQALCRGRLVRNRTSDERIRLDNFVGLIRSSSKQEDIRDLTSDIVGFHERRVQEQRYCEESYKKELQQLKEVVLEEEGFDIQSELREERIRWITDQTVSKHELPDSLDDFYKKDISQTVNADDTAGSTDPNLDRLKECIDTYEQRWKRRSVGADRIKSQSFDIELAKTLVIRNQVREELIPGVDEKLLSNLQKIKATQESDKKMKSTKKDKGKGKGKKEKKKGKKEKPLPGSKLPEIKDMKVPEMLECLIENDLIHDYDQRLSVRDFIGSFEAPFTPSNDSDGTQDVSKLNDAPNPWQLRKAVVDACILPMGSQQIKSSLQEDEGIRSILFYGPEGAGKTLMTEIVASEVNAMVIKLSSTSIENAFEGGDDATKLIHMIFTVAKDQSLSPVIIHLDQCHEFFTGKSKKKGSSSSPDTTKNESSMKRFQESLLIYKNQFLTKQDRVLVIGCTNAPEAADMKLMRWKGPSGKPEKQGFFEHAVYFPNLSQSSRALLWKEALRRKMNGTSSECHLDFHLLAYLSDGCSAKKILEAIDEMFSNQVSEPLSEACFASKLASLTPPQEDKDDHQLFVDFRRQWENNGVGKSKTSK